MLPTVLGRSKYMILKRVPVAMEDPEQRRVPRSEKGCSREIPHWSRSRCRDLLVPMFQEAEEQAVLLTKIEWSAWCLSIWHVEWRGNLLSFGGRIECDPQDELYINTSLRRCSCVRAWLLAYITLKLWSKIDFFSPFDRAEIIVSFDAHAKYHTTSYSEKMSKIWLAPKSPKQSTTSTI